MKSSQSNMQQLTIPALILAVALAYTQYPKLKKIKSSKYLSGISSSNSSGSTKPSKSSRYSSNEDGEIQKPDPLWSLTPDKVKDYDDRPWRPFRWPYHQTMSVFRLDINHWLDMDKFYIKYLEEKKRVFDEHGSTHCDWLPECEDAAQELLDTVVNHMLTRYPMLFKRTENGIHNLITDEKIDLSEPLSQHPLLYISKLAKEDFYIVKQSKDDGLHRLVGAAVPFPGGYFAIKDKLGKHLDLIHAEVPYYDEKLKPSMERWFSKLKPSDPVERASWYITWDYELLCSKVYMVDKVPEIPFDQFTVRVERQTLRRLPKSRAIIFTNHPVYYTIDEMKDEPGVPSILKKVLHEGPPKIYEYKSFEVVKDYITPYLDGLIQRQIDMGIINEDHVVKTASSYPFAHWVKSPYGEQGWTNPIWRDDTGESGGSRACPF